MNDVYHTYIYAGRGEGKENAWSASLVARIDGTYSTHFVASRQSTSKRRREEDGVSIEGRVKIFSAKDRRGPNINQSAPLYNPAPVRAVSRECINPHAYTHTHIHADLRELLH